MPQNRAYHRVMFKFFKRMWAYMSASANTKFEERADPKVQLEQAIGEAQDQHRRLTEQAANVIANQKQTEMRLNRSMEELERLNGSTRQALLMVDDAQRRGDAAKAAEYNQAAEGFANRLIAVEKQVDDLKNMHLQTTQAADQAKAAVQQNSAALQKKLAERQKLMSQLDQAKMQEQMNKAMATLAQTVGPGGAQLRPGAGQDRGPLCPGHRGVGAAGPDGGGADARGGAGQHQHRGPVPPVGVAQPAGPVVGWRSRRRGSFFPRPARGRGSRTDGAGAGADAVPSPEAGDAVPARPEAPASGA